VGELILPPGVKLVKAEEVAPREVEVQCARCRGSFTIQADTLKAIREEAGGRPVVLAHEVCPEDEPAPPAHTYYIEIRLWRDQAPERPKDDALLAWFKADQAGDSILESFDPLVSKLTPIWETLMSNLGILEDDDPPDA
jgi:hypothetical protein